MPCAQSLLALHHTPVCLRNSCRYDARTRRYDLDQCLSVAYCLCARWVRRYWSLKQILRRSREVEDLIAPFARFLLATFCYLYQRTLHCRRTHTTTQGKHKAAPGFRKNPHYRKGYENQSKFLAGNDVLTDSHLSGLCPKDRLFSTTVAA